MPNNALSNSNVSAATAFLLDKGYFNPDSPFLPQSISILAEANTANQSGLSTNKLQITSARQAAEAYGYGSPQHIAARILFPVTGGGVQVPVYCFAQEEADGAVAKVITITPSGTATASGTIYLKINGRETLDGGSYAVNIVSGDTVTQQCDKMRATIAAVLGCPVTGSGSTTFIATAKWKGLTSNGINIEVDMNGYSLGVTYSVANTTAGSGTPAVTSSLQKFGNDWNTLVINSYGLVDAVCDELEAFNGKADPLNPTGRFDPLVFKPILAFSGTVSDDPTAFTDARADEMTIVSCPAPLSLGLAMEAAANYARVAVNIMQNTPNISTLNQTLPDMPSAPEGSLPAMVSYTVRDAYVKKGCSTCDYENGIYTIKDLVTTYHKTGEIPPFYRYVRDMNVYSNFVYRYKLRENQVLWGKQLANDSDTVSAPNVITPKMWKAEIVNLVEGSISDGLLVDLEFTKRSIVVTIGGGGNPNRMDTDFDIKISGVAYQSSTKVRQGFNFGEAQ